MLKIGICGINGRIGQKILDTADDFEDISISIGFARENGWVNNIKITNDFWEFLKSCDAVIDFSSPDLSTKLIKENLQYKRTIISGTTGFSDEQMQQIKEYSKNMKIFISGNMSYGVNLIKKLIKDLSTQLNNADIEITEEHHKQKKDAPSGTALMLAESINQTNGNKMTYKIDRNGKRKDNEIGFSVKRAGNIIGNHEVSFYFDNQVIKIRHEAFDRKIFAHGALKIVKIIHYKSQNYGLFTEDDIF